MFLGVKFSQPHIFANTHCASEQAMAGVPYLENSTELFILFLGVGESKLKVHCIALANSIFVFIYLFPKKVLLVHKNTG